MRLAEDRFYNRFPCIIITAKGQPDVATRLFLRRAVNFFTAGFNFLKWCAAEEWRNLEMAYANLPTR